MANNETQSNEILELKRQINALKKRQSHLENLMKRLAGDTADSVSKALGLTVKNLELLRKVAVQKGITGATLLDIKKIQDSMN